MVSIPSSQVFVPVLAYLSFMYFHFVVLNFVWIIWIVVLLICQIKLPMVDALNKINS
jgi:hypothetical protein